MVGYFEMVVLDSQVGGMQIFKKQLMQLCENFLAKAY